MTSTVNTPFPLGAYFGWSAAASDALEPGFVATMGTAPQFNDVFMDYNVPVSGWVTNATDLAASSAQFAKTMTPVIDLPMASLAAGSMSRDDQYKAFASGQYDSVLQDIVKAWAKQGFSNLVFRPGSEMNLNGVDSAGTTAQSQADWVAAFQHIYTVLHQAATADGVQVQVVWNPDANVYSSIKATTNLYPGDAYVDVIGADIYSDILPLKDSTQPSTYHDWATGSEDTSVAQFIANPINQEHYWSNPAATKWSLDGSGGASQSLDSLLTFAEQHHKPFAIPETGAGNSSKGVDVADDGAFPMWLSQQLVTAEAAGEKISFVNLWDSTADGDYAFSEATDNKPQEAAAWAKYFGAQPASPTIVGAVAGQVTINDAPIRPFAGLYGYDAAGQTETATVTLSNPANGRLSQLGGGSYNATTGIYTITGSPIAITTALQALVFTPTATPGATRTQTTTGFKVRLVDSTVTVVDSSTSVVSSSDNTIMGSAAPLTVTDAVAYNSIIGGAGGLNATLSGGHDTIAAAAAVTVTSSYNVVTGGTGLLTVTDPTGTNTITGGSGGLNAKISGAHDVIRTVAGASDTILLQSASNTVGSNGADLITATVGGQIVTATGNATIHGAGGSNTYTLGGNDSLTSTGKDHVSVTGGSSSIQASGTTIAITLSAGSAKLTETGGGDNDAATVSGTATITAGAGIGGISIMAGAGVDAITLGAGSNTVTSSGIDTIRIGSGAVTLSGSGATLTVTGGSGAVTLADTLATVAVAGAQRMTVTGHGDSVHFSATTAGDDQVDLTSYGASVTGGAGLLTVTDAHGSNTIAGGAGGLDASVSGGYDHISASAAATVSLRGSGDVVTGGAGLLTVTDTRSTTSQNTITGGIGGINAIIDAQYDLITTKAGAADSIDLELGGNAVNSNGRDTITMGSGNETINATGNATIYGGTGYGTYRLSGTDTLTSKGSDKVTVSGGSSTILASGTAVSITQTAGSVHLTESGGGDNDSVTVSGAATILGVAGRGGVTVVTGSTGPTTVTLGAGSNTVTSHAADIIYAGSGKATVTEGSLGASFIAGSGSAVVTEAGAGQLEFGTGATTVYGGSGEDHYSFLSGKGGGTDTIHNFRSGVDHLTFENFTGDAVSTEAVVGGSMSIALTDHTQIVLVGVTQKPILG